MDGAEARDWARVKAILAGALERTGPERAAYLDTACGADATVRREVESLLAAHASAEAGAFIEAPAMAEPEKPLEGRRVGPYLILAEIGRGGMGAVYRGVRADDQFQQQVALKVVRALDPDLVRRFRSERQILAGLDHPGIARLLDGGATEDGLPWLAMDYVEGQPITEYVAARALPLRERLHLFREVCAAVHYAHQKLVVHRDLKPSNIFVTPAGAPRLLDFGIAKLLTLEDAATAPTASLLRAMTPEYASPEQVRGEAITTASDVYSLGVVLCELLTGQRPYRFTSRDPVEVARLVTAEPPLRPSLLARASPGAVPPRQLEGDLDTIVLMALRKEPERRYSSADQLAEDVLRHLQGRPVIARPDTLRYRGVKFVRRNRGLVAAGLASGIALLAALATTAYQASVARRERARAEQRFEDVRALANSVLFELHDAIENLPGSTPARQLLVSRGLAYLDRLSAEGGPPALRREVANGYVRLGDLQGRPNFANIGDPGGARTSYGKAVASLRALAGDHPEDQDVRRDLASALHRLGTLLADEQIDVPGAVEVEREALALSEALVAAAPDDLASLRVLLSVNTKLGDLLASAGREAESLAAFEKALPRYQALAESTGQAGDRFNVAIAHAKVGNGLTKAGRPAEAVAALERARDAFRTMAEAAPDASAQRSLAVVLNMIGDIHVKTGDRGKAVAFFREALAIRESMAPADPQNVLPRSDLVGSYLRLGDAMAAEGDDAGAARHYGLALPILEAIERRDKDNPRAAADRAGVAARLADVEARSGRAQEALARYATVTPPLEALHRADPESVDARYDLAAALAGRARVEALLATATASRELWRKARASYARSLELWRGLDGRTAVEPRFEAGGPADNVRAVEAALARCDEALRDGAND